MGELPLYLEDQTEENILQRMLARVPSDIDISEGSFMWDAAAPAAFMLSEAALWAQQMLNRGFAATAYGDYLDLRCAEHGVVRREAAPAAGTVIFTGTPGSLIPSGTIVATPADEISGENSIDFATNRDVVLGEDGLGSVPVRAVVAGKNGNVPGGTITVMTSSVSGISAVTNEIETRGGADIESDESLLARFLEKVRSPGTSGNKAQYRQWAFEQPGVGGVQVQSLWKGPGTVGIYLLDSEKRAAGSEVVQAVQHYIDPTQDGQGQGAAPAGAVVTVMAAEEVPLNISVKLTLAGGSILANVKTMIEKGIRDYLKTVAFTDPLVRYTRIAAVLLDLSSIIDYADLTINGVSNTNLEIPQGKVAVLGTVNVGE
ncbi:baseplate J/gp47 family protein [Paenibacillus zeisoli]|uniref:Baseplate J/gp47 family protein n=1 Tax=Paenibacillus zeisoli TaxID=2496267 RepID=A0A433XRI0_9BACL|nr:baseplate J/gp47 family protein [Paenibacillus zeisoli]RUT36629.1 baseplate J/gp47 family protein [Paenibacillus zeisoli]